MNTTHYFHGKRFVDEAADRKQAELAARYADRKQAELAARYANDLAKAVKIDPMEAANWLYEGETLTRDGNIADLIKQWKDEN